jgi:photosystem II stability/assembly factor-like uncharacterized protein
MPMRAPALLLLAALLLLPTAAGQAAAGWRLEDRSTAQGGLTDVLRISAQRLCGAGQEGLWCSADDGRTWTRSGGANGTLTTVVFPSAEVGWALGPDQVLRSRDGGRTWTAATPPEGQGLRFLGAFSASNALVASGEAIWSTTDGGSTWTKVQGPSAGMDPVRFYDARMWYALAGGQLHSTTDAGATWQAKPVPWGTAQVRDVRIVGAGDLAVLASNGTQRTLWWTDDRGQRWNAFLRTPANATSVFLAEGVVWLGGPGYLASSYDGKQWTTQVDDPAGPEVRFRRTPEGTTFAWAATNGTFAGYYQGPRPAAPAQPPAPLPWDPPANATPPAPPPPPPKVDETIATQQRQRTPGPDAWLALAVGALAALAWARKS